MEYASADLSPRERYKVLTSFVLPRPIAWVTSVGRTGVVCAAADCAVRAFASRAVPPLTSVSGRPPAGPAWPPGSGGVAARHGRPGWVHPSRTAKFGDCRSETQATYAFRCLFGSPGGDSG